MLKIASGLIGTPAALGIGALGAVNKRIILPLSTKFAEKTTIRLGILDEEEAWKQTELFYDYLKPVTNFLDNLEAEVLEIFFNDWTIPLQTEIIEEKVAKESITANPESFITKEKKDMKTDSGTDSGTKIAPDVLQFFGYGNKEKKFAKNVDSNLQASLTKDEEEERSSSIFIPKKR